LPAIVQNADTGAVLMLGYMNSQALQLTLERERVVFFSRSRQTLWEKGETSGNTLDVVDIRIDCDADTLLVSARPRGPTCHEGTSSCFGDEPPSGAVKMAFLSQLQQIIAQRIQDAPEGSYTAKLYSQGPRRMAQKVGEEGVEVALAAIAQDNDELISECSDLIFHLMVLLHSRGLSLEQVAGELKKRHAARV
jgi:phosphoribosyl-ATP pyrophosphohydrolase/phosphoribosyl-AMP cyclohydrolase